MNLTLLTPLESGILATKNVDFLPNIQHLQIQLKNNQQFHDIIHGPTMDP